MRHESAGRRPGDFQAAVDAWGRALELDPNQYIWRRRIEQYGPRLAKPYSFYDWVAQAKAEVSRRGETPVPLTVEPYGSELAGPVRDVLAEASAPVEPDPKGQIHRDEQRLIEAEVVVVPARVRPGQAARVHVTFRPGAAHKAHWNNESTPLRVWVAGAEGWTIASRLLEAPQGDQPESDEVRRLDFEVKAPRDRRGKDPPRGLRPVQHLREGGRTLPLPPSGLDGRTGRCEMKLALKHDYGAQHRYSMRHSRALRSNANSSWHSPQICKCCWTRSYASSTGRPLRVNSAKPPSSPRHSSQFSS